MNSLNLGLTPWREWNLLDSMNLYTLMKKFRESDEPFALHGENLLEVRTSVEHDKQTAMCVATLPPRGRISWCWVCDPSAVSLWCELWKYGVNREIVTFRLYKHNLNDVHIFGAPSIWNWAFEVIFSSHMPLPSFILSETFSLKSYFIQCFLYLCFVHEYACKLITVTASGIQLAD